MWRVQPTADGKSFQTSSVAKQSFDREEMKDHIRSIPGSSQSTFSATEDRLWGGGNTLRIGRKEHDLFDQNGLRASQLLDLFHVGIPGTNLKFGEWTSTGFDAEKDGKSYAYYDPRDHQPPPTAPDGLEAKKEPWSLIYDDQEHAQSEYQQVFGHLNINTAPSRFEIESMLRGPFANSSIMTQETSETDQPPNYIQPTDSAALKNGLNDSAIPLIAAGLMKARPFYSPSHLARVLSFLIDEYSALPPYHNDAMAEETFARIFNTTNFSSRHFRIFTYGEILSDKSDSVLSSVTRVYEVFLRPVRGTDGEIDHVELDVLSMREL